MLTRIAMGIVCSLALMLQSSQNYPTKPIVWSSRSGLAVGLTC